MAGDFTYLEGFKLIAPAERTGISSREGTSPSHLLSKGNPINILKAWWLLPFKAELFAVSINNGSAELGHIFSKKNEDSSMSNGYSSVKIKL